MEHTSISIAVIMERLILDNKWCSEKWEAKSIIPDASEGDKEWRVIFEDARHKRILFSGFEITLYPSESEGYYLNMTTPAPKIFIAWRYQNDMAVPYIVTVSYSEAARWLDSSENVDPVPMPFEIAQWLDGYVQKYYKPEPKKRRHPQSFISPGERGR